jgi:tRNA 2-selenouridine synthase
VVVEAESSKVGDIALPKQLWAAMRGAPRLHVAAPVEARAAYLARAYADVAADRTRLAGVIALLRPLHPAEVIGDWLRLAGDGAVEPLALGLMARHYDPRYEKHRARSGGAQDRTVTTESLAPEALGPLADRLAGTLRDIFG